MSQTYDANKPESGVTTFGQLYGIVKDHTEALRSQFSGATFPANPVIGQPCWHTNRNTAYGGALYFYSGDVGLGDNGWIDAAQASLLFNTLQSEVTDGRGTAANLDARLSIALNDDGSLKAAAPAGSWWTTEGVTVAYASASTFTIAGGDKTAIYKKDLALKLTQTTDAYCYVKSAGHDGTYNTVTVKGGTVDAGLTAVDYGQPPGSDAMPDRLVLGSDAAGDMYYNDATGAMQRLPIGTGEQVLKSSGGVPVWEAEAANSVPVRQTVLSGRSLIYSTGDPNFLSVGSGLAVDLDATAVPVVLAFANGFGTEPDYKETISADVTGAWNGLTQSSTLYLFIDRNPTTGALTYGFTALPPKYEYTVQTGELVDQHTFIIPRMEMWRHQGSDIWDDTLQRIFVGECTTDDTMVTSVTTYALRGEYDSGWFSVVNSTLYTKQHNIGVEGHNLYYDGFFRQNSTYETAKLMGVHVSVSGFDHIASLRRNEIKISTGGGYVGPISSQLINAGSASGITSGEYRFRIKRIW